MLKVNNRNTRSTCEICSELTIKTPEQIHWHRSGVIVANFEHISHLVLVFLLKYNTKIIRDITLRSKVFFIRKTLSETIASESLKNCHSSENYVIFKNITKITHLDIYLIFFSSFNLS